MYIAVAFYTKGTPYEDEIKKLQASLEQFDIPYDIEGLESRKNWRLNCNLKPTFISTMLDKYSDKDILYLDSDAIIRQKPVLFDNFKGDIGIHYKDGWELLSGTIFLKNNRDVRDLISRWVELANVEPFKLDQLLLQRLLDKATNIKIERIPASYTQIFDLMAKEGEPIIEHFQASRRFRGLVSA